MMHRRCLDTDQVAQVGRKRSELEKRTGQVRPEKKRVGTTLLVGKLPKGKSTKQNWQALLSERGIFKAAPFLLGETQGLKHTSLPKTLAYRQKRISLNVNQVMGVYGNVSYHFICLHFLFLKYNFTQEGSFSFYMCWTCITCLEPSLQYWLRTCGSMTTGSDLFSSIC